MSAFQHTAARRRLRASGCWRAGRALGFNTQPPEGGCCPASRNVVQPLCFNTQPPEGGCDFQRCHSARMRSFNTQPPEGGCAKFFLLFGFEFVSTHSRPKAAAGGQAAAAFVHVSFNTQPPEGGCLGRQRTSGPDARFQHTAARRRLRADRASR